MKPLKLFMDTRPGEQPENTYPFGKNGVQFSLQGASFNEPGFAAMAAAVPYTLMGIIETSDKPVLFSTDDTNSAIGFFNPSTGLYEAILDDNPANLVNWPADGSRLGFKKEFYITGQAQRNYKGELVVAFTDKNTFPKYLNCDVPDITRLDDIRMFAYYSPPTIELAETIGGTLSPGTYYVSISYERNDGTTSPRSEVSQGLTIPPGAISGSTDKAVQVIITDADTSYDMMRIAIISKIAGKTTAVQLADPVPISSGTVEIIYTGDNLTEDIEIAEILTPPAVYSKVGTMGQLNDALYIGELEIEPDLDDLQPYAAMVRLNWKSELIDATAPPEEHRTGKKKSLMHEEVYAAFIRYHKTRGGYTKAFIIPGLPGTPADSAISTEATTGGEAGVKKYKVEDTIAVFDVAAKTGSFGVYLNDTEVYPNTDEFNSLSLGGPDLRGQPVRHHKVPSLRWCKANLYAAVPEYGKTHLDLIGIEATNIEIPAKYADVIDGYEIMYAKRTPSNMTIYGQGLVLHGAVSTEEDDIPTGNANIYTTGGNWMSEILHEGSGDYNDNWELTDLRMDTFRIHPFDLLLNKPAIQPNFISAQYKLKRTKLRTEGYLEDGAAFGEDHDAPQSFLVDYTLGLPPVSIVAGRQLRKINDSFHLPIGLSANKFNNVRHESTFGGTLAGTNWPLTAQFVGFRIKGQSYSEPGIVPDYEEGYIVNLMALKNDVYANFYSQALVSAGNFKALDDSTTFWGGDTFLCDYTYHTYGRHDSVDTEGDGVKGIKVIRRIVCESTANIHLRYEVAGNEYSKWYPRTSVASNKPEQCYITMFDRSKDPNQFGYSKDLNALNDFISSSIFNPYLEELTIFPYRIHRGGKISRQNRPRSWRSFLPLDFYECQKNRGRIINLHGMDDHLLIHHEYALFRTQDKAKLDAGLLSVTLGTGDIFQFEPQESLGSKLGYAGTQHDLACVMTPMGYVFADAELGELFILKGELKNLNEGIDNFLRQYLKIRDKNPYIGNGITIGWDQDYKRILLSVKNERPGPAVTIKYFVDTDDFFNSLVVGDIVNYGGKLIKYEGLNNPAVSLEDCPAEPSEPDSFGWVAEEALCEQDEPITQIPHMVEDGFTFLSSPGLLQWDGPSDQLWVADHDNAAGNFYKINIFNGIKTYMPLMSILYNFIGDSVQRKIYATSVVGGLKILDINTETISTVAYGTDGTLNRVGLWSVGDSLLARDIGTGTINIIHKTTHNLTHVRVIATDIPSGAANLSGVFNILDVNGEAWIIPNRRYTGGVQIYNATLDTLLGTVAVTSEAVVAGWGGDAYHQTAYFDQAKGVVYLFDTGSGMLHTIDPSTYTILTSRLLITIEDTESAFVNFILDPITGSLYMNYHAQKLSNGTLFDYRIYIMNRDTGAFSEVYHNDSIPGDLVRQGATPWLWVAVPGNKYWDGGSWNFDGSILKYAHGE